MTTERSRDQRAAGIERRAQVHAALGDPHRLAIADELALSDRSPSDLVERLEIPSNLLAHHLHVLEEAGLAQRLPSSGDRRRRYVRLVPGTLAAIWSPIDPMIARSLLFVCTENSARSHLAAALWNALHDVPAESAGTHPARSIHPEAVRSASAAGLDIRDAHPRSLDEIEHTPDLLVTVCDRAHEELEGRVAATRLHWSTPDPAADGTPAAFEESIHLLSERVAALATRVARSSRQTAPTHRPRGRRARP